MRYRIEKDIPTPYGAFAGHGGTYRWLWMAHVAKWFAELFPDLRAYRVVRIVPTDEDGDRTGAKDG